MKMDKHDEEWKKLYDTTFPQIKAKYDAACQVFLEWNTRKIDGKTAIERYGKLIKK